MYIVIIIHENENYDSTTQVLIKHSFPFRRKGMLKFLKQGEERNVKRERKNID